MSTLTEAEPSSELSPLVLARTGVKSSFFNDLLVLAKVRLTAMVVITTAVGFIMACSHDIPWLPLLATALGTWLLAGGAAALNEWLEIIPDSRMVRTCSRPLPRHRLQPSTALLFALLAAAAGLGLLLLAANVLTALLGLANLIIYAFIYTPLKRRSSINTLVGAVCGAIPPLMGFTAVVNSITVAGLALAALLFVWQIPHFLALAWLYRDDYTRAGFRMLSVTDTSGYLTGRMAILYSSLLIPVALAAGLFSGAGGFYSPLSILLGLTLVGLAIHFARWRTRPAARLLFFASVIYLPVLMLLLVAAKS